MATVPRRRLPVKGRQAHKRAVPDDARQWLESERRGRHFTSPQNFGLPPPLITVFFSPRRATKLPATW